VVPPKSPIGGMSVVYNRTASVVVTLKESVPV
jgi:hypothetical protein